MRIVIIGNGVAAIEAALTIRKQYSDWNITLVSEESDHFFARSALMWVLAGQLSPKCIEPYERDLYTRMNFTRIRARVIALDIAKQEIRIDKQAKTLHYDRLLIACGSKPRKAPWPGSDKYGVGYFVTYQDLLWLETELFGKALSPYDKPKTSAKDSPYFLQTSAHEHRKTKPIHPIVVGGGLIGMEVIEVMQSIGLQPRFFIREQWLWPIALEPRESKWICKRLKDHGIKVHMEENIQEIQGKDCIESIQTDKGSYPCDLLVTAIGVLPNTQWLHSSSIPLDTQGGIIVNHHLETSAKNIFAAGDCASVPWLDGTQRPEQLWYSARDQGRVAGKNICGNKQSQYKREHIYNSAKLMDIEYTTAGLVNMNVQGEQNFYFEEQGPIHSTNRIVVSNDHVIGFNFLGRRWNHQTLIEWIEQQRTLEWVLSHLHEASFDTELIKPLCIPNPNTSSHDVNTNFTLS